jgi:hypothetical protein
MNPRGHRLGDRVRVRVWFGEHQIAAYSAAPAAADAYAAAMRDRFGGLTVAVDPHLTGTEHPMPCELLWGVLPP